MAPFDSLVKWVEKKRRSPVAALRSTAGRSASTNTDMTRDAYIEMQRNARMVLSDASVFTDVEKMYGPLEKAQVDAHRGAVISLRWSFDGWNLKLD